MTTEERLIRVHTLSKAIRKCYTEEIKMNLIECFLISIDQIVTYDNDFLAKIKTNLDVDDRLAKEILGIK
jgi:hypothetical protein